MPSIILRDRTLRRRFVPGVVLSLLALLWSSGVSAQTTSALPDYMIREFGAPPTIPDGPIPTTVQDAIAQSLLQLNWGSDQMAALAEIAASKDPRFGWLISDLMRFSSSNGMTEALAKAAAACWKSILPHRTTGKSSPTI